MTIVATAEPVSTLAQEPNNSHEILMYTDQVNRTEPTMATITLTDKELKILVDSLESIRIDWSDLLFDAELGCIGAPSAQEAQSRLQDVEAMLCKLKAA